MSITACILCAALCCAVLRCAVVRLCSVAGVHVPQDECSCHCHSHSAVCSTGSPAALLAALTDSFAVAQSTPWALHPRVLHAPGWLGVCREMAGVEPNPSDPWATRELLVKWKRYSHIHASWEPRAALSALPGCKRVVNYCRRADELAGARGRVSREEQELRDVEAQMEEQLHAQYSQVRARDRAASCLRASSGLRTSGGLLCAALSQCRMH